MSIAEKAELSTSCGIAPYAPIELQIKFEDGSMLNIRWPEGHSPRESMFEWWDGQDSGWQYKDLEE